MLDSYDRKVLRQIAEHVVKPGALVKIVELLGRPMETALAAARYSKNPIIQKVQSTIANGITVGIKKMLQASGKSANDQQILQSYQTQQIYIRTLSDIKDLHLEYIDSVAEGYQLSNALSVGVEGAAMGAAAALAVGTLVGAVAVPTIVAADVSLSLALLSRNVCQIGATYGYSAQNPLNLPHFIAALAPHQSLPNESYFVGKSMALQAIYQSKQFLLYNAGRIFDEQLLGREAPQLLRLLYYVLQKLGILVTEKELAMLLPVAGATLNGGVNVVFQKMGHQTAKDYFRILFLEDKYGQEVVMNILQTEVNQLRRSKGSMKSGV